MDRRTFNKLLLGGGAAAALAGSAGVAFLHFRSNALRLKNPDPSQRAQIYREEFRQQKMKVVDGFIVAQSETTDEIKDYEARLLKIKSTQ
jgi:formiminotetrahydrofolate cyclodeaminase